MKTKGVKKLSILLVAVLVLSMLSGCTAPRQNAGNEAEVQENGVIEKLISAEHKQMDSNTEEFIGLSDVSAVGVDMERFETETLKVMNETDFDVVIDAAEYGIVADDLKDDSLALVEAIKDVKKANGDGKSVLLKLPAGELDFVEGLNAADRTCAVLLSDLRNVCLLGDDTMLTIHGAMLGIKIRNCENLVIKGIEYDYGRAPFSVGTVYSASETSVKVIYPEHYPITENMKFMSYLEYNHKTLTPRGKGNFMLNTDIADYEIDGQTVTFKFHNQINPPVRGILVVTSHYMYGNNAFDVSKCKNLILEDINLYTTAGMGLVCEDTENIYVNRFNIRLKPNTDRLMTTTADGMHFGACRGEIKITNCIVENTHDDACNVKTGHYYGVSDIDVEQKTFKCVKLNYMHGIKKGDVLRVFAKNLETVADIKVAKVVSEDDTGKVIKAEKLPTKGFSADVAEELLIANASTAPKVTFENNVVRNKRNRGILLQTKDSVIRNNAFINVGHGAISVMTEASQFNEAIVPENIVVENNKLIGCNGMGSSIGADIAVLAYGQQWANAPEGAIKNITIRNNFIANTVKKAISLSSVSIVDISNNCIFNPATNPISVQNNCAFSLAMSNNITMKENYVEKEETEEYVALFTDGTVLEEQVIMKENIGVEFAVADVSVEPDTVKRLPKGVAVNMNAQNLDDFEKVEKTINFIGFTDSYGQEVTPTSDSFEIKTFKVAYDDKGIYVGFEVKDDMVEFSSASSFWNGDGFELYMTPATEENYAFPQIMQTYNDTFQLFLTTEYLHVETSRTSEYLLKNKENAFESSCWETEEGYAGKLFINFDVCTELKEAVENGKMVSCSFILADSEQASTRVQVSNTAHNVENNKGIPVRMGKIRFE